jgi:membrane-associated phospholipid phosphatase
MSDPVALQEGEPVLPTSSTSKSLYTQTARYVSALLSPFVVSLPAVFLVALYHAPDQVAALAYTCLSLFFLSIGPMLYILVGVRLGKFSDVDVSRRSQRTGPFLFGIISSTIGLILLALIQGPKNLQTVMLMIIVSGSLMMMITFWWKISIHASSVAGAITTLTLLYGMIVLPAFSLVVLVGWSRVALRRHTVTQVIAGSLVGIVTSSIILMIRGT